MVLHFTVQAYLVLELKTSSERSFDKSARTFFLKENFNYLVTSWLKGILIVPYRLSSSQKLRPSIPIKKQKSKKK